MVVGCGGVGGGDVGCVVVVGVVMLLVVLLILLVVCLVVLVVLLVCIEVKVVCVLVIRLDIELIICSYWVLWNFVVFGFSLLVRKLSVRFMVMMCNGVYLVC